jgi:hypothetical protein
MSLSPSLVLHFCGQRGNLRTMPSVRPACRRARHRGHDDTHKMLPWLADITTLLEEPQFIPWTPASSRFVAPSKAHNISANASGSSMQTLARPPVKPAITEEISSAPTQTQPCVIADLRQQRTTTNSVPTSSSASLVWTLTTWTRSSSLVQSRQ